jgi:glucose-6-phosphate isomerase
VLVDEGSGIVGFADWAEQLIAESTGKDGTGVLPVVVDGNDAPEVRSPAADVLVARLVPVDDDTVASGDDVRVSGALGAQLLLWEAATAVAGRLLAINPFDQPDVESAKKAARALLDQGTAASEEPAATDGAVEIRAMGGDWLGSASTVTEAVDALLGQLDPDRGYVAVMAYLDRLGDAGLATVRPSIAERTGRPTTFGWGPRFLHSTGQFHKGGPAVGVYVQITTTPGKDLPIPGREFTFGDFIASQAGGDAQVLADHGRPVLRLHLTDHDAGLAQVTTALSRGGRG